MNIKQFIADNKTEMLDVLAKTISYNTVENHDNDKYPFGQGNADCLEYVLEKCQEYGMRSTNLDYYAGFAEYGAGDKLVGIIGHLDTVPFGEGWLSDPTTLVNRDGKLYGRGTIDDKGPMIANLFAIKYLIENKKDWKQRLRIVFGSNEESGFQCVKHYVEKEGHFDIGYTPDGSIPCCFGEKGILQFSTSCKNTFFKKVSGGLVANAVPANFEAEFSIEGIDIVALKSYFDENNITYELSAEYETVNLVVKGVAAHGSTPTKGVNAVAHALVALKRAGVKDPAILEIVEKIGVESNGESLKIAIKDQYGDLTLNLGVIKIVEDNLEITFDVRCPFTHDLKEVTDKLPNSFDQWTTHILTQKAGIYVLEDSEYVQMLTKTANEVFNIDSKPITMGGGTYARGINNIIAFGPKFTDEDNHMHDANEFIREEHFFQLVEMYAVALEKMLD
ncbi:MAG: Sapep family Mn(2+)-dependent dipeptidase [Erysipelotrichaceae bacterium]